MSIRSLVACCFGNAGHDGAPALAEIEKLQPESRRPGEMHDHRRKSGQRAVGIALTDRHPDAVAEAGGHPQAAPVSNAAQLRTASEAPTTTGAHHQRHHLPELRHRPMLQDVLGAAAAIAEILAKQAADRSARIIDHERLVGHPDAVTGRAQPVVEFGVLVVAEALVIAADGAEGRNRASARGGRGRSSGPSRPCGAASRHCRAANSAPRRSPSGTAPKPSVAIDTTTESAPVATASSISRSQ